MRAFLIVRIVAALFLPNVAMAAPESTLPFYVEWGDHSNIDGSGSLNAVYFIDSTRGWIVGSNGVFATNDGGVSWHSQLSGSYTAVYFLNAQKGWVAGREGEILATKDGGANWYRQSTNTDQYLTSIQFTDAANGWAVGYSGTVLATRDGGNTWQMQSTEHKEMFSAVYFFDKETGWAVGASGIILATLNGGKTWTAQDSGISELLSSIHFVDPKTGWVAGASGTILATNDGGNTWHKQITGTQRDLLGIYFVNVNTGWTVGVSGTILATRDGGANWVRQRSKTTRILRNIHFANAKTGWVVGLRGIILRSSYPIYSSTAYDVRTPPTDILGQVHLSFKMHGSGDVPVSISHVWARIEKGQWISIEPSKLYRDEGAVWHIVWSPQEIGAHPGDNIEYRVQPDDVGPPVTTSLGRFVFEPWWTALWRDYRLTISSITTVLAIFLLYVSFLGTMLIIRPARLATFGPSFKLAEFQRSAGSFGVIVELIQRLLESVIFPWFCRNSRVRRAWAKQYLEGKASIDQLGSTARAAFVFHPQFLDLWVEQRIGKAEAALERFELFRQRKVFIDLPVWVGDDELIEKPRPEVMGHLFRKDRNIITIVGVGGSGKSTLACEMARWALAEDLSKRLMPHRMIPVFVAEETADLMDSVTQNLRRMLGTIELPADLVRGLLSKQRILVIVDALSERDPATQEHITRVFGQESPINAVVITSRTDPALGSVDRVVLRPVRLDAGRLVPFIIAYLDRMDVVGSLKDGRTQLQLAERVLSLAESGGHRTTITVLLVTLFVDSAVRRMTEGKALDDMPEAVPEVFIDYLRCLNGKDQKPERDEVFILATQAVASASLGTGLVPRDFVPQAAMAAIVDEVPENDSRVLLDRLIATGVIERRTLGGRTLLRFSLDPVAEYLGAIRQLFMMKAMTSGEWINYFGLLERTEGYPRGPEGYLSALATCYRTYKMDLSLPEVQFPWEQ